MIVDTDDVQAALVRQIRAQVGSELSTLPNSDPELASVIQDIQGGERPPFPFIMVELEADMNESGGFPLSKHLTVGVGDVHTMNIITEQRLIYTITCMGDKATHILKLLRIMSTDDIIREQMNEDTCTTFQYYSDIDRTPVFLYTDFVNAASMQIHLLARSNWERITDEFIEQVDGEGRYLDGPNDENPLIVPFSVDNS